METEIRPQISDSKHNAFLHCTLKDLSTNIVMSVPKTHEFMVN